MQHLILRSTMLIMMSIGWRGSFGTTESQGQTCRNNYVCTAFPNTVSADYATVGGGASNTAKAISAAVAGGAGNTAGGLYTAVGGRYLNAALAGRLAQLEAAAYVTTLAHR